MIMATRRVKPVACPHCGGNQVAWDRLDGAWSCSACGWYDNYQDDPLPIVRARMAMTPDEINARRRRRIARDMFR